MGAEVLIAAGASIIGGGLNFLGSKSAADAQSNAAALQAQVALKNNQDNLKFARDTDLRNRETIRAMRKGSVEAARATRTRSDDAAKREMVARRRINNQTTNRLTQNLQSTRQKSLDQQRATASAAAEKRRTGFEQFRDFEQQGLDSSINSLTGARDLSRNALQEGFDRDYSDTQAQRDLSIGAQNQLAVQLGLAEGDSSFETSPGYQFLQDEARDQVERSAAAQGGLLSGAAMKALQDRAQGVASQDYNNFMNNLNAAAARTAPLLGSQYAANLASLETGYGQNVASLQSDFGQRVGAAVNALGERQATAREQAGAGYASTIENFGAQRAGIIADKGQNAAQNLTDYQRALARNNEMMGANIINANMGAGTAQINQGNNTLSQVVQSNDNYTNALQSSIQSAGLARANQAVNQTNSLNQMVGGIAAAGADYFSRPAQPHYAQTGSYGSSTPLYGQSPINNLGY